jgi:hypothetical protein
MQKSPRMGRLCFNYFDSDLPRKRAVKLQEAFADHDGRVDGLELAFGGALFRSVVGDGLTMLR